MGKSSAAALKNSGRSNQAVGSPTEQGKPKSLVSSQTFVSIYHEVLKDYMKNTPRRLRLIDAYLLFTVATGLLQGLYCLLAGSFPFNAFLSGFISCVASFVFTASLRFQTASPHLFGDHRKDKGVSNERAFIEWVFCNILLHIFVLTFIG